MTSHLRVISFAALFILIVALEGCSRENETADPMSQPSTMEPIRLEKSGRLLEVSRPWIRLNPIPGRPSAVFFELVNAAEEDDLLTGVSVPGGGRGVLHIHEHRDGIMRMFRVDSVAVPAGEQVTFAPRGQHVMLFGVSPLKVGSRLTLILHLQRAGDVEMSAEIRPIISQGPESEP